MLKSPDPHFCPFANHLPASFLNIFESISDLKVICAQSWGHIEAHMGAEVQNSFKEVARGDQYDKLTVRHQGFRKYVSPNQTCLVF